jgi:hypothetical protein
MNTQLTDPLSIPVGDSKRNTFSAFVGSNDYKLTWPYLGSYDRGLHAEQLQVRSQRLTCDDCDSTWLKGVVGVSELEGFKQLLGSRFSRELVDAVEFADEHQVVPCGHLIVEIANFGYDADPLLDRQGLSDTVSTGNPCGSGRGFRQACEHTDGGCLASTVRSEKTEELTSWHMEAYAVDSYHVAILLRQVPDFDCALHLLH